MCASMRTAKPTSSATPQELSASESATAGAMLNVRELIPPQQEGRSDGFSVSMRPISPTTI